MISASHNPAEDNGIKFFGPDGFKLSDAAEEEIERMVAEGVEPAQAGNIGRAKRIDEGRFRYMERLKATLPHGMRLDGVKVVVDCAHGAAYRTAPDLLWELGADVVPLGTAPNGSNINDKCGSTHPDACAAAVVAHGADLGICLDTGDEIGASLPVTALVDQFYKDVQKLGGGRWDTSALIKRLTELG